MSTEYDKQVPGVGLVHYIKEGPFLTDRAHITRDEARLILAIFEEVEWVGGPTEYMNGTEVTEKLFEGLQARLCTFLGDGAARYQYENGDRVCD